MKKVRAQTIGAYFGCPKLSILCAKLLGICTPNFDKLGTIFKIFNHMYNSKNHTTNVITQVKERLKLNTSPTYHKIQPSKKNHNILQI
jgi:hypothetical protein